MNKVTAIEVHNSFKLNYDGNVWAATLGGTGGKQTVRFSPRSGLCLLIFNEETQDIHIQWIKLQAAFGDYAKAASTALSFVASILDKGGIRLGDEYQLGGLRAKGIAFTHIFGESTKINFVKGLTGI